MAKAKLHPMIEATLGELPARNKPFGLAQRASWLRMMAAAFDLAYGPEAPIAIYGGVAPSASESQAKDVAEAVAQVATRAVVAKPNPPRFFIDTDGIARRDPGGLRLVDKSGYPRIMPKEVSDVLFDDRGEHGDLGSITWADGSTGVLGLQVDISATPEKVA